MIVALASELTVLRARLDTCERMLADKGLLDLEAIDRFSPAPEAQAQRDALRRRSMAKIFRAMIEASDADLASADSLSQE